MKTKGSLDPLQIKMKTKSFLDPTQPKIRIEDFLDLQRISKID